MSELLVAIHQPNFFPWLGYFDKIIQCDRFVFLDHVQFPKKGGVWTNRVKLLVNGESRWVTAPVDRSYHGTRMINEMEFQEEQPWKIKLVKTLEANYRHSAYYQEIMDIIRPLIELPSNHVAAYNMNAIVSLAKVLGVPEDRFIRSSELNMSTASTELLIGITQKVGGTSYLCGGGAEGYQEDTLFKEAGLKLVYQHFSHPEYTQQKIDHFEPGLSIIDALFQVGVEGTRDLLKKRSL